ncbi:MAG: TonB-dependent receptor [Chiayiivirga sp.]|jgi:iron complex outermembrane receptor protein|uniref:TonB-dependent receptor n=1 Tax=Chiayiivirga sp. TaxID=2041042 RepID=UPI0025C5F0E3|nr:TonB-dependent receptor [Chiayiivirga sp.]MCI1728298.1 TonB-dependent receptor [Chiayiivirga sp.]
MSRVAAWVLASVLTIGLARAEEANKVAADSAAALDRIVVSAQQREQAAQDVATALTVIGGEQRHARGIERVSDLQYATPGLEIEPAFGTAQPYFRLRGVGFVDYMSNNSSSVGVSLDGVAQAFPIQSQGLLFDLERLEVLRGPQGTLHGRNTTGGTIQLVSAAPNAEFDAGARVDAGARGRFDAEAFVTGSVGQGLRGRLSLARSAGGAWQRHRDSGVALGDRDARALRAQLDADVGATWQVQLDLNAAQDRSDSHGLQLLAPFSPALGGDTIAADRDRRATAWALRPEFAARVGLDVTAKPGRDFFNQGVALTVIGEFEQFSLTSVSGFNRLRRREYADFDATAYAESDQVFRSRIRSQSQEWRLQSRAAQPLAWTAGAFVARDRLDEQSFVDLSQRLGGELLTEYRQDGDTLGVFGQVDWELAPDWRASLGARRDHERRELSGFQTRFIAPPLLFAGPAQRELEHSGNSGRLALERRSEPGRLWYASLSRGVKSGGFTAHNTPDAATLDPFEPETLLAWETGVKADLGRQLRLNAALFHYDYRDQQVLSAYFEPLSQSLIGIFANAPRSRIDGIELELEYAPTTGVALSAFAGYKRGEYTAPFVSFDPVASFDAGANVFSDYNGASLDFPRLSAGAQLAHALELSHGRIDLVIGASYRSRYEQTVLLGRGYGLDPYWLANASLSFSPRGTRWSLGAYARNLFDADHDLTRNYYLPGTAVVARGEPREVGLRLAWGFH